MNNIILTTLKHYLYDIALNAMFDKILSNFPMKRKYEECNYGAIKVGDYILVVNPIHPDDWSKGHITKISTYPNKWCTISINVLEGRKLFSFNPQFYTMYKIN